eukprot:9023216-Ditylum_brightwellii.AAC.1
MDFYPLHSEVLQRAKILPKHIPTGKELNQQQEDDMGGRQKKKEEDEQKCRDNRTVYFVIGHLHF